MHHEYETSGTCSKRIFFDITNGRIYNVRFLAGCNGNLKGIGALLEGRSVDETIARLEGLTCGARPTSCPDQLARALKAAKEQEKMEENK